MADEIPVILLPGMGADAGMFAAIRRELPQVVTPPWIAPVRGESIGSYARRFAKVIDPGGPCFIGGASFGGVMAQELAAILPHVRGCFVIGSIRTSESTPKRLRMLLPLTPFVGILPVLAPLIIRILGSWLRSPTREVMRELACANPAFLRWGTKAILKWTPSPEVEHVRVFHIHGDRDRVFPISLVKPDCVVPGAGHLITITHSREVAECLRDQVAGVGG